MQKRGEVAQKFLSYFCHGLPQQVVVFLFWNNNEFLAIAFQFDLLGILLLTNNLFYI
jgi:hypothetical protein